MIIRNLFLNPFFTPEVAGDSSLFADLGHSLTALSTLEATTEILFFIFARHAVD
jgi:hypothetical protein